MRRARVNLLSQPFREFLRVHQTLILHTEALFPRLRVHQGLPVHTEKDLL